MDLHRIRAGSPSPAARPLRAWTAALERARRRSPPASAPAADLQESERLDPAGSVPNSRQESPKRKQLPVWARRGLERSTSPVQLRSYSVPKTESALAKLGLRLEQVPPLGWP